MSCSRNEYDLNPLTSNNWRASLVPAAAVIPAPVAYIKVVAVKKLVVGFQWFLRSSSLADNFGRVDVVGFKPHSFFVLSVALDCVALTVKGFTLRKLGCFKQEFVLNTLAWNNTIGPWFYFVSFGS